MDPFTLGILFACGASGAVAAMGWARRKRPDEDAAGGAGQRPPRALPAGGGDADALEQVRVGDVLVYTREEYWLAGSLSLVREGDAVLRLFSAPERGRERWVALPRDGRSIWVLFVDKDVQALGWPGVELPTEGKILRRAEQGSVAIMPAGEMAPGWEGMGRYAMFRGMDGVAVVLEGPGKDRLALVGKEIPRQLVQKMG